MMPTFLSRLLPLLCTLVPLTLAAQPGDADAQQALSGGALLKALQRGGQVIYFRHADTGPAYLEQGVDLTRCDSQRNLNGAGRAQSRDIGSQFRRLRIPLGEVLSSEFCRCRETAELAFGRYAVDPLLTGVSRSAESADRRIEATVALKMMLAKTPAAGVNTVLISHGFNLWDAEGFHLGTQGEAAIYRPDGAGGYVLLARLRPGEWAELGN